MNKIFILTLLFNSYLINVYGQTNNTWAYIINEPKKYNFKIQSRLVESTIIITPSCTTQKWKYQFKKFGAIEKNAVIKWNYKFTKMNCPSKIITKDAIQEIIFQIPKGSTEINGHILIENVLSLDTTELIANAPSVIYFNDPPSNFSINGPRNSVWQGDLINMEVATNDNTPITVWEWYKDNKGKKEFLGTGKLLRDKPISNTKYYLCSNVGGFKSSFKEFNLTVTARPDPPSNFTFFGTHIMTDIETSFIYITPNTTLDNVKWLWYKGQDTKPFFEGDILTIDKPKLLVTPKTNNINLKVQSEYYGKKSIYKTFDIKVNILPEPPSNFKIILPTVVNDNDLVWLKAYTPTKIDNILWVWSGPYIVKTQNDSILIKPEETSIYELKANLNGKISKTITSKLFVNQKSSIPKIEGNFSKCEDDIIGKKYTIIGGKLGTKSKNWVWYEKTNNFSVKLGIGKDFILNPKKTTKYFVTPDNNPETIKEFEITVHALPRLPISISGEDESCLNDLIQLYPSELNYKLKYLWRIENLNNKYDKYNTETDSLSFFLNQDKRVTLQVKDDYCFSNKSIVKNVTIYPNSSLPNQIYVSSNSKLDNVNLYGGKLSKKSEWAWYDKDNNLIERTKSTTINYKFTKSNNILFVRAEGPCDTTEFKSYTNERKAPPQTGNKLNFLGIGTFTNDKFNTNNLMLTLGVKKMYFRFKTNYEYLLNKSSYDNSYNGQELKNTESNIYNYPSNSNTFYSFTQDYVSSRLSITAGFMLGKKSTKIYFGGGYGVRDLYWKVNISDYTTRNLLTSKWTNNTSYSYRGGELESGLFINIGRMTLMTGASAIFNGDKNIFIDGNFGIGFNW